MGRARHGKQDNVVITEQNTIHSVMFATHIQATNDNTYSRSHNHAPATKVK